MAHTGRILLVTVALAALTAVSGCFFVDGQFAMSPDGSVDARIEAGVLQSMAGENDIAAELDEGLAEGRWTQEEPVDRDQWRVTALVGHAGPGESLFKEDADPQPRFEMTRHLLSTTYGFVMPLPDEPVEAGPVADDAEEAADDAQAEEGEGQIEGMEDFGEAFGDMMAMMMTSGDSGLRFSVGLPGVIIDTNGTIADDLRVHWKLDIGAEEPQYAELVAHSRLPNWSQIGRLGAQLTERGRWDLVPALIAGVQRGILPDPVTENPETADFNVLMYVQALEIMVALDHAVGEQIADAVMTALGLGGAPDPAMVEEIAVRLEGMDLAAEIDQEVTEQLLRRLGGG